MSVSRPILVLTVVSSVLLCLLVGCGVGGGSNDVPPLASDFAVGATIPGWVISPSSPARDEVGATSWHDGQRWNVILTRELQSRPRDTVFSVAIGDDSGYHAGLAAMPLTFDPQAQPQANQVVGRRVANGQVTVDGAFGLSEWNPSLFSFAMATAQNELPTGKYPAQQDVNLAMAAAYDDVYVYLLFQWVDPSGTRSDIGPQLQWDGTQWVRRPHVANDANLNGIADPGEPMNVTATQASEDRLSIFWPIQDEARSYVPGGSGCADSCHANAALDPMGSEAVHALDGNDLVDVWTWGAAREGASLRARDGLLSAAVASMGLSNGGSGLSDDPGARPSLAQGFPVPDVMFAASTSQQEALVGQTIDLSGSTPPGFPAPGPVVANAAPYLESQFNGTTSPPQTWTGMPPFQNDFLPAWVMQPATDSASDVEAAASFAAGIWTLEMRRRRITRDATGAPRRDDVQFEEDVDLGGVGQLMASQGLPFSLSVTDRGRGHGVRESEYRGPLRLSGDAALAGPTLASDLYLHDYGTSFAPTDAADFTDGRVTRPIPEAGADVGLELKAGTDGQRLFILASWDDATVDRAPDEWTWNGFTWVQAGDQDELRMLFNVSVDNTAFIQGSGCATFCHSGPGGPWFGTSEVNDLADLWHWQAGRTALRNLADDLTVDWRSSGTVVGGAPGAWISGDVGPSPYAANVFAGAAHPAFMAAADPNANALALTMFVSGMTDAVPFLDVLGGLPATMGGSSGVSFQNEVLPIFVANCTECHPAFGGLNLTSWSNLMMGGSSGPVVVPGEPNNSLLIQRLQGTVAPSMPLGLPMLPALDIQTIANWISEGALDN